MNQRQALAEARSMVGNPIRRRPTDWVFYTPHDASKPRGPSQEVQANSYPSIVSKRTAEVATCALIVLGHDTRTAVEEVNCITYGREPQSAERIVSLAVKRIKGAQA